MRTAGWCTILVFVFVVVPLVACLQVTTDTGSVTTGSASSGASAGSDGGGSGGADCTQDPTTQVVLCAQISACPGLSVDPAAFPGCGFRVGGATSFDLECLCSGSLCPVGVPTTCTQATQLLQTQSVLGVCQQVSEGRCVQGTVPEASTVLPSCDRTCQSECGGAADCLELCGC